MHERDAQRGFTIVELMIVVAIIAVLAAVVIPSFIKESNRGKAKSEVSPMFAELASREDAFKLESNTGVYMDAAACPASASSTGTDVMTSPCTDWTALRVQPTTKMLTCSYQVVTGTSSDNPLTHGEMPAWVNAATTWTAAPATTWYFIKATCPNTEYFQASWDTKIRSKDGH